MKKQSAPQEAKYFKFLILYHKPSKKSIQITNNSEKHTYYKNSEKGVMLMSILRDFRDGRIEINHEDSNRNFSNIKVTTTRPPRFERDDSYLFVTDDEMKEAKQVLEENGNPTKQNIQVQKNEKEENVISEHDDVR